MCRRYWQTARLPSCGCEGKAGILVEYRGGYNLGFITYVLPQLVLIAYNQLRTAFKRGRWLHSLENWGLTLMELAESSHPTMLYTRFS